MGQESVSNSIMRDAMSRLPGLTTDELEIFQLHARDGMRLYALKAPNVVDHDCQAASRRRPDTDARNRIRTVYPHLVCPCGTEGWVPDPKQVRNALAPRRPISYEAAVGILRLIDRASKTREWRATWGRRHPGERDRWDLANAKIWPQLSFKSNVSIPERSGVARPRGFLIDAAFFAFASPDFGNYGT